RAQGVVGPPGGAHDGVDAVIDEPVHVLRGRGGDGEVDRDLGTGLGERLQGVVAADARDQLEVGRLLDGAAGGSAHPAGGAEDGDADAAGRGVGHGFSSMRQGAGYAGGAQLSGPTSTRVLKEPARRVASAPTSSTPTAPMRARVSSTLV